MVGGKTSGRVTGDYEASLLDISISGAMIEHAQVVRPGTVSSLDLELDGKRVNLLCRVIRSVIDRMEAGEEGVTIYHTGLEFVDLPDETRQAIRDYIQSISQDQPILRSYTCDKCGESFDLADSEVRPVSEESVMRPVQTGDQFSYDHGTCKGTLVYTFGGPFAPWKGKEDA